MSAQESGHAYGIGILTIIVGVSVGIFYYQVVYIPETLVKPSVDEHILNPVQETIIKIILGSANTEQQDNFVPKLVNIQLGIDNYVIWVNDDDTPHTVTPDHRASVKTNSYFSPAFITPVEPNSPLYLSSARWSGVTVCGVSSSFTQIT